MNNDIHIIDLFSGPGGLGEGFCSSVASGSNRNYKLDLSIEKDPVAHKTLLLRSFLRKFKEPPPEYYIWLADLSNEPMWSELYPDQWEAAINEAWHAELGKFKTTNELSQKIHQIKATAGNRTLLIGGPPCQAYSLVGRSRNAGIKSYKPKNDHRHYLYQEYCRVLNEYSPSVFVMENVKGILSTTVEGHAIFETILNDLASSANGYELFALSGAAQLLDRPAPQDFILKSEEYGIPQARHRVIIVGIKRSIADKLSSEQLPVLAKTTRKAIVKDVLHGMPKLRSGLSRNDDQLAWYNALNSSIKTVGSHLAKYAGENKTKFLEELELVKNSARKPNNNRKSKVSPKYSSSISDDLLNFLRDERIKSISCNNTRGHMKSDLTRYLFASCFAKAENRSPKAPDFPTELAPKHANWKSGKFSDRFRVQRWNAPATTVTSHISKDGHYYIHPDPSQCRSLTVREAARLQTFPDNYHFMGNRTQQFAQVGNAVPPYLAKQIADALRPIFEGIE